MYSLYAYVMNIADCFLNITAAALITQTGSLTVTAWFNPVGVPSGCIVADAAADNIVNFALCLVSKETTSLSFTFLTSQEVRHYQLSFDLL